MSDTKPLPAQELLALADAMANTHTASPDFFEARDAYKAARAASPVTLEEALLREARQHLPGAIHTQDLRPCPECKTALRPSSKERCYKCFSVAIINARRLAGEGGAA